MTVGGVPIVITQDNLNELAVRQGGPISVNRKGNVVFQDDFSNGIEAWQWTDGANAVTSEVSWSAASHYGSGFSVKMACSATTVLGLYLRRIDPAWFLADPFAGLEVAFMLDDANTTFTLEGVLLSEKTPTEIWVSINETTLEIYSNNVNIVLANFNLRRNFWHKLKVVMDYTVQKYKYLILDNLYYDLSAYPLNPHAGIIYTAGTHTYLETLVRCNPIVPATIATLYVTNVIMTTGEE